MKLFLDTNILIDLVGNRAPFASWAYKIFQKQKTEHWKLYTSSNSVLTTYYILERELGQKKSKQAIKILLSRLEIIPIEKSDMLKGLITEFKDFEDAVQHECALKKNGLDYIITRNKKDFKKSVLPVLSSEELFIRHEEGD
ncbi:MAG: PIN domain-containing protein [Cyclobacteriaceae bacterium]|nr:PIN domain-containing protein [Cyclobacteriaceae bacterium]